MGCQGRVRGPGGQTSTRQSSAGSWVSLRISICCARLRGWRRRWPGFNLISSVDVPADARFSDLTGHTIIPGLVSLHEHLYFGGAEQMTPMPLAGPMLYLALGVTSAMPAGSQFPYYDLNLKKVIDAGLAPGPRIYATVRISTEVRPGWATPASSPRCSGEFG